MTPRDLMRAGPVIPVIVINDPAQAVPLAQALVAGGVRVLEVTLRTPVALAAIRAIADAVEGAIVGVGTITRPEDFEIAIAAGARFGVSPDLTFCPTGGVTVASARDFLVLPNVGCGGSSWLTPADAVAARDWGRITALAREAAGLRAPST